MSSFLEALESGPLLSDGAMGSFIFARTGRLSEMNHVYEALSADNPDLVRAVHLAYLQAGARCLTTNSFEANRPHLQRFGQGDRVAELNRAAVQRAREMRILKVRLTLLSMVVWVGIYPPQLWI